jgi:hypothetical protein
MPEITESTPMQCRHVFTDGRRCAAACLRHEPFCYYHHTTRRPIANLPARRRRSATFTLPELEDRASIQLALSEILQRIASNDIDPKRAGHLLFGLQIATSLLPKPDPKAKTPPRTVSEITHDEELGDLAPAQQVGADKEPDPEWEAILAKLDEISEREANEPKPFRLDNIQAVADTTAETVGAPFGVSDERSVLGGVTCLDFETWVESAQIQPLRVPPCPPRSPLLTSTTLSSRRRRRHLHPGHRLHIRHVLLHPGHRLAA